MGISVILIYLAMRIDGNLNENENFSITPSVTIPKMQQKNLNELLNEAQ